MVFIGKLSANMVVLLYAATYYSHLPRSLFRPCPGPNWWLAGVMLINRCGTMVMPFLTLYLTRHLHFSIAQAGYIMGIYGIGCVAGAWLGGVLTDRTGAGRVQFITLLLHGLVFLVLGRLEQFYSVAIFAALLGLVGEAFRPANAAATAYFCKRGERHPRFFTQQAGH